MAEKGKRQVVVDGKAGPQYDGVGKEFLAFSPDSKHFAYDALKATQHILVVDDKPVMGYDVLGSPAFNSDGVLECLAVKGGSLYRIKIALSH